MWECARKGGKWRWQEAKVDAAADHLRLVFQEDDEPSALVGPPHDNCFPVEFSLDHISGASAAEERRRAVRAQLDLYLLDVCPARSLALRAAPLPHDRQSLLRRSLVFIPAGMRHPERE
jgi:hypothetical protein